MTLRNLIRFAALAVLATGPLPANSQPLVLASSSKWIADYQGESCRLLRNFGTGDDQVTLLLTRFSPNLPFNMVVAGNPIKRFKNGRKKVTLHFGPSEKEQDLEFTDAELGEKPAIMISGDMMPWPNEDSVPSDAPPSVGELGHRNKFIYAERYAAVKTLTIARGKDKAIVLKLGSMKSAFAALDTCIDNLVASWGIDLTQDRNLKSRPATKSSPGSWLSSGDYPSQMIAKGQPALVHFRLMIGESGEVTSCHIQRTTYPKAFGEAVCNAVKRRARFEPAIDTNGKPVASYWMNTVKFMLPS